MCHFIWRLTSTHYKFIIQVAKLTEGVSIFYNHDISINVFPSCMLEMTKILTIWVNYKENIRGLTYLEKESI